MPQQQTGTAGDWITVQQPTTHSLGSAGIGGFPCKACKDVSMAESTTHQGHTVTRTSKQDHPQVLCDPGGFLRTATPCIIGLQGRRSKHKTDRTSAIGQQDRQKLDISDCCSQKLCHCAAGQQQQQHQHNTTACSNRVVGLASEQAGRGRHIE